MSNTTNKPTATTITINDIATRQERELNDGSRRIERELTVDEWRCMDQRDGHGPRWWALTSRGFIALDDAI